jgi:starch-binding outer membrane protein, SusD/RagB family
MKNLFRLTAWLLIMIGSNFFFSCSKDFLTKEPPGAAAGSVISSPDGVETVLVGTYASMKGRDIFGGAMGTDWTYGSITSDDCYKGTSAGDETSFNLIERYEMGVTDPYIHARWRDCYEGVARANSTLECLAANQTGDRPIPEPRATQIEAEAKFMRAWFHFQTNKVFERIPYIKTLAELAPLLPEYVPNTDPAWTQIEEDLQFAIENLPATRPLGEVGRAHKYAAEAVKAQAHMYQKEFDKAKVLLDDIINNGGFSLADNFYDNYDMTHENNRESIFEIQASTTSTTYSSILVSGAVFHQKGPASCGGWGFFQPSQCLFEAFQVTTDGLPILDIESREPLANDMGLNSSKTFVPTNHLLDLRVDWTIARRGVDFLEWGIHPGNDWIREQANGGPYMTKKYMHKKSEQILNYNGIGFKNGKNYRLYRLSNIILWRAEVAVEDGDLELARNLVNQIRNRAKNSNPVMGLCASYQNPWTNPVVDWTKPAANYKVEPYPAGHPAFASKSEARKAVRMEIRLEFATEGHRFFDLRRWGIEDEVLNDYIQRDINFRPYLKGVVYDPEKNDFWPLPKDQVNLQKGILHQDSSYLNYKY